MKNRKVIEALFQGYVKDFGVKDGGKIIDALVDKLGGLRISMPDDIKIIKERGCLRVIISKRILCKSENMIYIGSLYNHLKDCFGEASSRAIIYKLMIHLKGMRISFPDHEDIYRMERDQKIRNQFNGHNTRELAINWGLSDEQIKNIIICQIIS